MAKVLVNETSLSAIADAIREKNGSNETYKPSEMAAAIGAIETGGGGGYVPTDEELVITGSARNRFSNNSFNWLIDYYGDCITTKDITDCVDFFNNSDRLTEIPFQINISNCQAFGSMFYGCRNLIVCPKIRGTIKWSTSTDLSSAITYMQKVRYLDDLFTLEMLDGFSAFKVTSAYSVPKPPKLSDLNSLRRAPSWWYKFRLNPESTAFPATNYVIYYQAFKSAYALDEVTDIPVWNCAGAQKSNMFTSFLNNASRTKNITFETNEDGSPIVAQWKSQVIDLITIGHAASYSAKNEILNYNSGITADKEVKDDATYQALKNDPDWFATDSSYSRYNHDSAVATINSLPDTSAYLATAGGTNTIKFMGIAGSATDGGAINTLTEEEIAVATAKGWTVTFG